MDDKKKRKKYIAPETDVLEFVSEDIITLSDGTQKALWSEDDNTEDWA